MQNPGRIGIAWLATFMATIVLANWMTNAFGLIPIGFGLAVTAGTFAAGFALIARDGVQVSAGKWWALLAILAGCVLSAVTSTPAIAFASGLAFLVSELVDFAVFTPMRSRSLPLAVILSSILSAPIDTVLFLHLAGFGVTWQAVLGQFAVKSVIALMAAAWIARRR